MLNLFQHPRVGEAGVWILKQVQDDMAADVGVQREPAVTISPQIVDESVYNSLKPI